MMLWWHQCLPSAEDDVAENVRVFVPYRLEGRAGDKSTLQTNRAAGGPSGGWVADCRRQSEGGHRQMGWTPSNHG